MRTITRMTLLSSAFASGVLILGAGSAQAADQDTTGADSILGGTQAVLPIESSVNLEGNAISLLGDSSVSQAAESTTSTPTPAASQESSGESSILGGTQANTPINIPVSLEDNAISLLGDATSTSSAPVPAPEPSPESPAAVPMQETSGDEGILGGTQVSIPVQAPIAVTDNAISLLGDTEATQTAETVPTTPVGDSAPTEVPPTAQMTSGEDGVLSGTQVQAPVEVPVAVENNAISLLGDTSTEATTPVASTPSPSSPVVPVSEQSTTGEDGVLGGTQVLAPIVIPVDLSGNSISVLGDADVQNSSNGSTPALENTAGSDQVTAGSEGVLGGTQVLAPIQIPVNLGGNSISVLGDATSSSSSNTTTVETVPGATAGTTDGADGIVSGSQVIAPIQVPVGLSDNAISILGDASAETSSGTETVTPGNSDVDTDGSEGILSGSQIILPISIPLDLSGNAISVVGDAVTEETPAVTVPDPEVVSPVDPVTPVVPTPVTPTTPVTPVVPTPEAPVTPVAPSDVPAGMTPKISEQAANPVTASPVMSSLGTGNGMANSGTSTMDSGMPSGVTMATIDSEVLAHTGLQGSAILVAMAILLLAGGTALRRFSVA